MYAYDDYGWYTGAGMGDRSTNIAPPTSSGSPVVGQPWPNFSGTHGAEWSLVSYSTPGAPPAPNYGTKIRPIAFLNRFGASLVTLYAAAMTNPQVQIYRDQVMLAASVDLTNPLTIDGVNALAAATLIATDLATAILTNPVTPDEL